MINAWQHARLPSSLIRKGLLLIAVSASIGWGGWRLTHPGLTVMPSVVNHSSPSASNHHMVVLRGILAQETYLIHYQPSWVQKLWYSAGRPPVFFSTQTGPNMSNGFYYFRVGSQSVPLWTPLYWPAKPITGKPITLHLNRIVVTVGSKTIELR